METEVIKSNFQRTVDKSDFETAVIIHQDNIPKGDKDEFNVFAWCSVLEVASNKKLKKEAIERIRALELCFEDSRCFYVRYNIVQNSTLTLRKVCI